MLSNFSKCCAFTLVQEGGFCNVAGDPGGATNHGITMETLSACLGRQATVDDVKSMTTAQAQAIYLPHYWQPINGDGLPLGVDQVVFDFGVNAGPQRSAMRLQAVVGVKQDGFIGPQTLKAMARLGGEFLIQLLSFNHETYYRALPGFAEFGAGWLARAQRCEVAAMGML